MQVQAIAKPSGYMIPVGNDDDKRLRALGKIYNPTSIELMSTYCKIKNPKILDIGCGNGYLTCLFAKTLPDSEIVATDISSEQIEVAKATAKKKNTKNIVLEISDVLKLSDLEKTYPKLFHFIHIRFVLSHLPDPTKAIEPMLSMLKQGGTMIIEELGAKKKFKDPIPKSIQAWQKMVQFQHSLQQSHKDTVERIVTFLTDSGKVTCHTKLSDILIEGQEKKSMFRIGVEHALKILESMGKLELIKKFGYDDGATWLEDIKKFELDDSATLLVENYESIIAVKI